MILNKLCEAGRFLPLHPGFPAAFAFLNRRDLTDLASGTYEINGRQIYALVQRGEGKGREAAHLETHRRYIDIQLTLDGDELIGWRHASACSPDPDGWNDEKDICFFSDVPDFWLPVPPGSFVVFYPEEDAHAPQGGEGRLFKVVVKVEI